MVELAESTDRWFDTLRGLGPSRAHERVPFFAQVYVLPLDGRRPGFWAKSADLAERGVFLAVSEEALPIDSFVVLKLRSSAGELRLTGRVVHLIDRIGFGCEFVDLDESQREAIAFLVALGRFHAATRRH